MNILHIVETLNPNGGGLPSAVKALAAEQTYNGHKVSVVSCCAPNSYKKSDNNCFLNEINLTEVKNISAFRAFSPFSKWRAIFRALEPDVCHIHGLWIPSFIFASQLLYHLKIATIVSPHGQINPSLLQSDRFFTKIKKTLYWKLFARRIIGRADLIHAVCQSEADVLLKLEEREKIRVIYNFVEDIFFNEIDSSIAPLNDKKTITFIGRVEKRKGIVSLVEAFLASTLTNEWQLKIVGPIYDQELVEWIKTTAKNNDIKKDILITGPIYGSDRLTVYLESFIVCLPSFSEVVGLVNIEAALLGKLVITTPYAGINEIEKFGGIICENDVITLQNTLSDLQKLSPKEYADRCNSLREWAKCTFSREALSKKWEDAVTFVKKRK